MTTDLCWPASARIILATRKGDKDHVRLLAVARADVTIRNDLGHSCVETAMMLPPLPSKDGSGNKAIKFCSRDILEILVEEYGEHILSAKGDKGYTSLHWGARHGIDVETCETVCELGSKKLVRLLLFCPARAFQNSAAVGVLR